jgi:hypothetical protein
MKTWLISAALLFASVGLVAAQQIAPAGFIGGSVRTIEGNELEGASLTLRRMAGSEVRSAMSDSLGTFQFSNLPDGKYSLTVHSAGYVAKTEQVLLSGQDVSISVTLAPSKGQSAVQAGQPLGVELLDSPREISASGKSALPENPVPRIALGADGNGGAQAAWTGLGAIGVFRQVGDYAGPFMLGEVSPAGVLHGQMYGTLGYAFVPNAGRPGNPQSTPEQQYGASAGAEIGRSSLFASYDRHVLDRSQLLSEMLANPDSAAAASPRVLTSDHLLARLDHQFGDRDSLGLRFDRFTMHGNPLRPQGPGLGLNMDQQTLSVHNSLEISPATANETQGQMVTGSVQLPAGLPASGVQAYTPTIRRYRIYEAADNLYHQMGRQGLWMGGDFLADQMNISFMEGRLGNADLTQSSRGSGLYVLDRWTPHPNFQVTAGTRYDLQLLSGMTADTGNLAPQIGFSWSPDAKTGTVLRGGFGFIYSQIPLPAFFGSESEGGVLNLAHSARFAAGPNSLPWGELGDFTTLSPAMRGAYSEQANLGLEQQIGARSTISAQYQHVEGLSIGEPEFHPTPLCVTNNGCNSGEEFQSYTRTGPAGGSSYDGLSVSFVQNPIHWGTYQVGYTWAAVSMRQGPGLYDSLPSDEMHRVSFLGSLHTSPEYGSSWWSLLSHGLTLSGYGDMTARSELPGLDFLHLNARLTKAVQIGSRAQLECFAEAANSFDYRTYSLSKAASELSGYGMEVLASYQRFADLTDPDSNQAGLRVRF